VCVDALTEGNVETSPYEATLEWVTLFPIQPSLTLLDCFRNSRTLERSFLSEALASEAAMGTRLAKTVGEDKSTRGAQPRSYARICLMHPPSLQ
jgi:hypothetical protein